MHEDIENEAEAYLILTLARAGGGPAFAESFDRIGPRRYEQRVLVSELQHRTRNLARYTCRECGFRARLFYWQCPGCNRWETYAPRRSEALG